MELIRKLEDDIYVRHFQELCGITDRVGDTTESFSSENYSSQETARNRSSGQLAKGRSTTGEYSNNNNNDNDFSKHRFYKKGADITAASKSTGHDVPPYVIKYMPLYYLAKIGAFLGDELFFQIFFPFWMWNIDSVIGRRTFVIWCLVMYLGQATKDYLRWPRPASPPVHRLDSSHQQEYAMPSTHAMASTAIPLALFIMLYDRYEFPVVPAVAIGITWCVLVCLSRLYLGVHSILDVLCGFLFSVMIVAFCLPNIREFDDFQQTHPLSPIVLFGIGLAMCTVCYPSKDQNSAKGDAVQIISVAVGVSIGLWINFHLGLSSAQDAQVPYAMTPPSFKWCALSIARFVSGVIIGGIVRELTKSASIKGFSYFLGLDKPDRSHPTLQTTYKFVSYLCLGATTVAAAPFAHKLLGINRVEFYYEMK